MPPTVFTDSKVAYTRRLPLANVVVRFVIENGNSVMMLDDLKGYWGECGPVHDLMVRNNEIVSLRNACFEFRGDRPSFEVIDKWDGDRPSLRDEMELCGQDPFEE